MTDHLAVLEEAVTAMESAFKGVAQQPPMIEALRAAIALMRGQSEEMNRLRQTIDSYERGLISTPYTRALVDQHSNRATQYLIEVIRLNRVVARQSAKIKRMSALLRALLPRPAKELSR